MALRPQEVPKESKRHRALREWVREQEKPREPRPTDTKRIGSLRQWVRDQEHMETNMKLRDRLSSYAANESLLVTGTRTPGSAPSTEEFGRRRPGVREEQKPEDEGYGYGKEIAYSFLRPVGRLATRQTAGVLRSGLNVARKVGERALPFAKEAARQEREKAARKIAAGEQAKPQLISPAEIMLRRGIRHLETAGDVWDKWFAQSPQAEKTGTFDPMSPRWLAARVPEAITSVGISSVMAWIAPGGAVGKIAAFAAPNLIMEGGEAYYDIYDLALQQTGDPDRAEDVAALGSIVAGSGAAALETLPAAALVLGRIPYAERMFTSLFSKRLAARFAALPGSAILAGAGREAVAEGTTEAVQEAYLATVAYMSTKNPQAWAQIMPRIWASGFLGGIAGAGPGAISGALPPLDVTQVIADELGVPVEEVQEAIQTIQQEGFEPPPPPPPAAPVEQKPPPMTLVPGTSPGTTVTTKKRVGAAERDYTDIPTEKIVKQYQDLIRSWARMEGAMLTTTNRAGAHGNLIENQKSRQRVEEVLKQRGVDPRTINGWEGVTRSQIKGQRNKDLWSNFKGLTENEILRDYVSTLTELQTRNRPSADLENWERISLIEGLSEINGIELTEDKLFQTRMQILKEEAGEVGEEPIPEEAPTPVEEEDIFDTLMPVAAPAPAAEAEAPAPPETDLFGEEVPTERPERPAQEGLFAEEKPTGTLTESEDMARTTVSTLQGKVRRGEASDEEVARYREALKLLRRNDLITAEELKDLATGIKDKDELVVEMDLAQEFLESNEVADEYEATFGAEAPTEILETRPLRSFIEAQGMENLALPSVIEGDMGIWHKIALNAAKQLRQGKLNEKEQKRLAREEDNAYNRFYDDYEQAVDMYGVEWASALLRKFQPRLRTPPEVQAQMEKAEEALERPAAPPKPKPRTTAEIEAEKPSAANLDQLIGDLGRAREELEAAEKQDRLLDEWKAIQDAYGALEGRPSEMTGKQKRDFLAQHGEKMQELIADEDLFLPLRRILKDQIDFLEGRETRAPTAEEAPALLEEPKPGKEVTTPRTNLNQKNFVEWLKNAATLYSRRTSSLKYEQIENHYEVLAQHPEWIEGQPRQRLYDFVQEPIPNQWPRSEWREVPNSIQQLVLNEIDRQERAEFRLYRTEADLNQAIERMRQLLPKLPDETARKFKRATIQRAVDEIQRRRKLETEAPPPEAQTPKGPVPTDLMDKLRQATNLLNDAKREAGEGPGGAEQGFPSERTLRARQKVAHIEEQLRSVLADIERDYGEEGIQQVLNELPVLQEVYRGKTREEAPPPVAEGARGEPTERPGAPEVAPGGPAPTGPGPGAVVEPGERGAAEVSGEAPTEREPAEPEQEAEVVPKLVRQRVEPRDGESAERKAQLEEANNSEVFIPVRLDHIPTRSPHPRVVVETRSMASMPAPVPKATLENSHNLQAWEDGRISDEQVDVVFRGIHANENDGHGFLIADDVGVGKTREMLAFIFEAFARGKTKALYTTKNVQNVYDVEGEIRTVLGIPEGKPLPYDVQVVHSSRGHKEGKPLRTSKKPIIYLVDWYNWKRFSPEIHDAEVDVWVMDEAHLWKNQAAQYALPWIYEHNRMMQRGGWFMYGTATPGVKIDELQYLYGLKLWAPPEVKNEEAQLDETDDFAEWVRRVTGEAVTFSRNVFNQSLSPAETEQIMRELKGSGHYMSRDIWRGGVTLQVDEVSVLKSPELADAKARQEETATLVREILETFKTMKARRLVRWDPDTGQEKGAQSGTSRSLLQSYMKQLIFEAKVPRVLELADEALGQGRQVVISIHSVTGDPNDADVPAEYGDVPMGKRLESSIDQIPIWKKMGPAWNPTYEIDLNAEGRVNDLRRRIRQLERLQDPIEMFENHFGEDQVAGITGKVPGARRIELVKEFQDGVRTVAVISKAGKEGISLHDVNGHTRTMIVADYEWSADTFKQELGRVDRAGQKSAPTIVLVASDLAAERKFVATIAARMASLGATSKGAAESTGADALDEFDVSDPLSSAAARDAWEQLSTEVKMQFTYGKFRPTSFGPPVPRLPVGAMSQFLTDLSFLDPSMADQVMEKWMDRREELRDSPLEAKRQQLRTTILTGKILDKVPLVGELTPETGPRLDLTFVRGLDNKVRGILSGFVTNYMERIQKARQKLGSGKRRPRHYVRFTEEASGGTIAGLYTNTAEAKRIWEEFGLDLQELAKKTKGETALVSKSDADPADIRRRLLEEYETIVIRGPGEEGEGFEHLELTRTRSGKIKIMTLRDEGGLSQNGRLISEHWKQFNDIATNFRDKRGKFWILLKDNDESLETLLERFPPTDQDAATQDAPDVYGFPSMRTTAQRQYPPLSNPELMDPYIPKPTISSTKRVPLKPKARVDAQDVINAVSEATRALGTYIRIRVGVGTKKVGGFFDPKTWQIRIKEARNLPAALHETAHAITKLAFMTKNTPWTSSIAGVNARQQRELMWLGKILYKEDMPEPSGGYRNEGFAEFFRIYVQDESWVQQKTPALYEWWTGFLQQYPKLAREVQKTKELYQKWDQQGQLERGKASIVDTTSWRWQRNQWRNTKLGAIAFEALVDQIAPYYELHELAEKRLGRELAPSESPARIAEALRTTHAARAAFMVNQGMIDIAGNKVGPPLRDIRGILSADERLDWTVYLYALRTKALLEDPKGPPRKSGMSKEDAEALVQELQSERFDIAAAKFYEWNDGVLEYAAQGSPLFRDLAAKIRERDPGFYIPLNRTFEELDARWRKLVGRRGGAGGGAASARSFIHQLRGSGRRIKDPIPQAIANAQRTIKATHERMVIDAILKLASEAEGMSPMIVKVERDPEITAVRSVEELLRQVQERFLKAGKTLNLETDADEKALADILGETVSFYGRAKWPKGERPIIPFWNGETNKLEWYEVDAALYDALSSLDVHHIPYVNMFSIPLIALEKMGNLKRAGTTGMRASFGLVWNMERDPQTLIGQTQSKGMGVRLLASWFKMMGDAAIYRTTGKMSSDALEYFVKWGGEMSTSLGQDVPYTKYAARRLFKPTWAYRINPSHWGEQLANAFDFYRGFIQFPELAPRAAEVERVAKDMGIDLSKPVSLDDMLILLIAGKQVTTDFSAASKYIRYLNRIIPFLNAGIQGPRAAIRAFRRNPTKYIIRNMVWMTVPALMLAYKYRDEDWWKNLDWREKFLHWHIKFEIGGRPIVVRIPRAFEQGLVFSAFPEAMFDIWQREDPKAAGEWFQTFMQNIIPPLEPPLIETTREQLQNRETYWDIPIESESDLRLYPFMRYSEYTSKFAIWLGSHWPTKKDLLGVRPGISPKRIDHAIKGMFGPLGGDLLGLLGVGSEDVGQYWEPAKLPLVSRQFLRNAPYGTRSPVVDELYDAFSEAVRYRDSRIATETETLRQRRLLLEDATRAITAASLTRRYAPSAEYAREVTEEIIRIAHEALDEAGSEIPISEAERERFRRYREEFEEARGNLVPGRETPATTSRGRARTTPPSLPSGVGGPPRPPGG